MSDLLICVMFPPHSDSNISLNIEVVSAWVPRINLCSVVSQDLFIVAGISLRVSYIAALCKVDL